MWHDMFALGVPFGERIARAILVYVFAVVALRLAGKRELGQLTTFDLVVLLFFSNILQNSIIGNDNSVTGGVIGAATLLIVNHMVLRVLYRHRRIDALVEGTATYLIQEGVVQEHNLARELVTRDELIVACHKQGVLTLEEVSTAVLEPDGSITVFARQPTTDELVHQDLIRRFDLLAAQLDQLAARFEGESHPASRHTTP